MIHVHSAGIAALAVLALLPAGVARAAQYPDYKPLAANEYPSYQEQQGIGMAVVPIFDSSAQKRYLGVNLLAQGFLPVYVVIENHANPNNAILLRDQIVYKHDDLPPMTRAQLNPRPDSSTAADIVAVSAVLTGGVAETVVALHLVSNVSNVRMNLLKKELRSQTVAPNKAEGGFVFIPTGKSGKPAKEVSLDIPVKGGASDDDIHFSFRIEMAGSKK